jgi:hypothetical protein
MRNVMYGCCHFHFTSFYFTSLPITAIFFFFLWFSPQIHLALFIAYLTLFLKLLGLQERVPKASAGSWFQSCMVLFTKEYFPISVRCFLLLIFWFESYLFSLLLLLYVMNLRWLLLNMFYFGESASSCWKLSWDAPFHLVNSVNGTSKPGVNQATVPKL